MKADGSLRNAKYFCGFYIRRWQKSELLHRVSLAPQRRQMLMNFIRMCNNGSFRPFMEG